MVVVSGEVDHGSKRDLMLAVDRALAMPNPLSSVLFDLTACSYIDSAGLAVFLFALEHLPRNGWLGLIGAPVPILHLLAVCGFKDSPRVQLFQSMGQARTFIEPNSILAV